MTGLSIISALEIFTNPQDLAFTASEKGIGIFRGPGHNGKPIATGPIRSKDTKEAAEKVGRVLREVIRIATMELKKPDSFLGGTFNPEKRPLSEADVLTSEMVDKIVGILAEKGEAYSYKLD